MAVENCRDFAAAYSSGIVLTVEEISRREAH